MVTESDINISDSVIIGDVQQNIIQVFNQLSPTINFIDGRISENNSALISQIIGQTEQAILKGAKFPPNILLELGFSHELTGNTSKAMETYIIAKNSALASGEIEIERLCNCYLARIYFKLDDIQTAEKILLSVMESRFSTSELAPFSYSVATIQLSKIYTATNRNELAIEILRSCMFTPLERSDEILIQILMTLGHCHIIEGDAETGITLLERCLELANDEDNREVISICTILSLTYVNIGDLKKAEIYSEAAMKITDELYSEPFQKAISRESKAIYLFRIGDIEEAKKLALESAQWFEMVGQKKLNNNLIKIIDY